MTGISVIIPTYNRPQELRMCLEGFASQTAPRGSFELVIVDDGSPESIEPVVAEFAESIPIVFRRIPNSGPSAARNLALDLVSADLLVLYDDDLRPRPNLIEYCLQFHDARPEENHVALLRFRAAPQIAGDPFMRWAFPRMYPFPADPGICGYLWSGSSTCKKSIFRFGRFNEYFRALEDIELEIRLRRRLDLQIHFDRLSLGFHTRLLAPLQFFTRSYMMGYYDYQLSRRLPGIWGKDEPFEAESYILPAGELPGLVQAAKALLAQGPTPDSPAYRMLSALLIRADSHAKAEGWLVAQEGGAPDPPGGLRQLL